MAQIGEGFGHVGDGEAVLDEGASERVVVIVQSQEFEIARLVIEKPDGEQQEQDGKEGLFHWSYYIKLPSQRRIESKLIFNFQSSVFNLHPPELTPET